MEENSKKVENVSVSKDKVMFSFVGFCFVKKLKKKLEGKTNTSKSLQFKHEIYLWR